MRHEEIQAVPSPPCGHGKHVETFDMYVPKGKCVDTWSISARISAKGMYLPVDIEFKQDAKCISSQDKRLGEICLWEWKLELLHRLSSLFFLQVQPKRQVSQGEVLGPSWLEARGFPRPTSLLAASFVTGKQGHTHVSQQSISASN